MKTSNDLSGNKMFISQEMELFCNLFLSLFSGFLHTQEEKYELLRLQNSTAVASQEDTAQ